MQCPASCIIIGATGEMAAAPLSITTRLLLLLLFAAGGLIWANTAAQTNSTAKSNTTAASCGCSSDTCCSIWGYCGSTSDYCGVGCQAGPCLPPAPAPATNGVRVGDVVTQAFFDGIIARAAGHCPGKKFYTRAAFLDAAATFPTFARVGTAVDSRREIAAFFTHCVQLTTYFCTIANTDGPLCCDDSNVLYKCARGKKYFARGPIQLAWNYNYGAASTMIDTDILRSPEAVADNATVSFQSALWFWMFNVHPQMASGGGFASSIAAVQGDSACDGNDTRLADNLVARYKDYCAQFGVDPGGNISCVQSLQIEPQPLVFGDGYLNLNISISIRTF